MMTNMQASGTTTIEKPPVSNHFSDTQKLRAAQPLHPVQPQLPPPPNYQAQNAAMPPFQHYPPQFGFQHYPYPQHNPGFLPHPGHHMQPAPHFDPAAHRREEPVISSPGIAFRLRVPLTDFCTRYFISDSDQRKLQELEYRPGDKLVENLEEKEWKDGAKFSALGWRGFLAAHRQFCEDVKEGLWNVVPS